MLTIEHSHIDKTVCLPRIRKVVPLCMEGHNPSCEIFDPL